VIDGATSLGGRTVQGAIFVLDQIVAVSRDQDLALLKFKVQDTPFLKLGSSANSVEGQKVLVIGNPEGFQGTVSDGIIAAFREGRSYIQITAPISPGSSGYCRVCLIACFGRARGYQLQLPKKFWKTLESDFRNSPCFPILHVKE
jgi:hypothetical protein